MTRLLLRVSHQLAIAAVASLMPSLWLACTDATDPGGSGQRIAVGDTIAGELAPSDTVRLYRFTPAAGGYYAVFFEVLSGGALVLRTGYTALDPLAIVRSAPGHLLAQGATEVFLTHAAADVGIRVIRTGGMEPAAFRFVVSSVNRQPEVEAAAVALGDTISGETLETIADVDDFTFTGEAGQTVIALLQAEGPAGAGPIRLQVVDAQTLGLVESLGGDSILGEQVSGAIVLPAIGGYRVTVLSVRHRYPAYASNYQGPYRFAILPLQLAPELVPAEVGIGDTVFDEIEPIGDIDEFYFTGATGQELRVFFQALSGRDDDLLYLDVPLVGGYPATAQSIGTDTSLAEQATSRFTLPSPGPHQIRVRGADGGPGGDRTRYRLFVYPIDRQPEGAPATLTLGDTATASIEWPGDVDEYTLSVAGPRLANFVLRRAPTGIGSGVAVQIGQPGPCGGSQTVAPSLVATGTGVVTLADGDHRVSVCGGHTYRGGYRLETFAIDTLPESRSDTIVIGDTIDTEALEPPGDMDRFVFHGMRGRHIDVYLQGQGAPSAGGFGLLVGGADSSFILASVGTPTSAATLDGQRTYRIDLPVTGWYRLLAQPGQNGGNPEERGDYRFAVVPVPGDPETVSPDLVPGDSITTERLEDVNDVDEYFLTGTANQELAVFVFSGETGGLTAALYDTLTGGIVEWVISGNVRQSTGRFLLPAGGLGVRVYSPRPCPPEIPSCVYAGGPGYYFLQVFAINRAPESTAAAVAVGDTVGESIEPIGDVDEYTFSGASGDVVRVLFETPSGVGNPGLVVRVVDPASGSELGSAVSINPSATFGDVTTGPITLPQTGPYLLHVEGVMDTRTQGAYRFSIELVP